jgi:hypothetical protein
MSRFAGLETRERSCARHREPPDVVGDGAGDPRARAIVYGRVGVLEAGQTGRTNVRAGSVIEGR